MKSSLFTVIIYKAGFYLRSCLSYLENIYYDVYAAMKNQLYKGVTQRRYHEVLNDGYIKYLIQTASKS